MAHAERHEDRIYLTTEMRERDMVKTIPGSNWDKDNSMWWVPLSWGSCIALRAVFSDTLTLGPEITEWGFMAKTQWVDKVNDIRYAMEEPSLMESEPHLFPFQRVGVRFLEIAGRALLGDDMGSGKTIQLIRTVARLDPFSFPVLIVCPNSMKYTWAEEIEKWAPGYTVSVVDGTKPKRVKAIEEKSDFTIINWESLRLHTNLAPYGSMNLTDTEKEKKELNAIGFETVIADEAHRAKDAKSKQTRALWAISRDARYRFGATGTPIEQSPDQLWSIMNFISPNDFPRKTKYIDRYCQQSYNPFGGMDITGLKPETEAEFHAIVKPRLLRRPKDIILPQLPDKVESVRYIPFTGKQKTAYNQMAASMLAELKDGEVVAALNPLQQFMRLSQFASAFGELDDEGKMILTEPSNKIDAFMELLDEAEGEQIVCFAESKQLIMLLADKLRSKDIAHGLITGDQEPAMRQTVMDQFQNGNLRIVLCTSAGAEGITLTAARILVFLQRFWSSIKNKQAADRVHRIGQERGVDIITFATRGTVDEHREKVLDEKGEALQEILRDDDIRAEMLSWGKKRR